MRNTDKTEQRLPSTAHVLVHLPQPTLNPPSKLAKSQEEIAPQEQNHQNDTNAMLPNDKLTQLPPYIMCINVGGKVFTTTTNTMKKSGLFNTLLSPNCSKKQTPATPQANREISFEKYCNEYKDKDESFGDEQNGIYQINSSYYFVDRSPSKFDDILHFLRNYPAVGATQFIERYCCLNTIQQQQQQHQITRNHSLSSALSLTSLYETSSANINHKINIHLLKLQDEARFYKIDPLIDAIQEKLDCDQYDKQSYKWWDRSGPIKGIRRIPKTRIAFATAMDNWVDLLADFEIPPGYIWCTQSQYLAEYHAHREALSKHKEWIHFGIGDWDNYRWKYARKVAFIFKDSFKSLRFVHSGMEVCDINHVKSLSGYMSESPLMEFEDTKGITEGFAGLVLLSNEEYHEENESPPSETSSWTSDEDDEQIQSLKALQNSNKNKETKEKKEKKEKKVSNLNVNNKNNENKLTKPKTAVVGPISFPHALPAMLGAASGDLRKRATLTKNNLIKHTQIEEEKHKEIRKHSRHISFQHLQQSPPQYIHHQLPRFNFMAAGNQINQLTPVPAAPQLMPRLSVNSLPAPNISHHHMNHRHLHHQNTHKQ